MYVFGKMKTIFCALLRSPLLKPSKMAAVYRRDSKFSFIKTQMKAHNSPEIKQFMLDEIV